MHSKITLPLRALAAVIATLFLGACADEMPVGSIATTPAPAAAASSGASGSAASMISAYRVSHGLNPVTVDPALNRMAAEQARAMAAADEVGHSVAGGASFGSRLSAAGLASSDVVENAAGGGHYGSFGDVFSAWRASPGHNENLLRPGMTRVGVAAVHAPNTKHKIFWSLDMAGPPKS